MVKLNNFSKGGYEPEEVAEDLLDDTYARQLAARLTPPTTHGSRSHRAAALSSNTGSVNTKNIKIVRNTAVMLAHLYINGPASARTLTGLSGVKRGKFGALPKGDRWGAALFQTPLEDNPYADASRRASLVLRGLIAPATGGEGARPGATRAAQLWKITRRGVEALLAYSERTGESIDRLSEV